jgi:hypothetical protein
MEGKTEQQRRNGGSTKQPRPPFPEQHQDPPGLESELDPKPRFEARQYRDAGKLVGKVALITGGDSGIGRAVATMFAREGAAVAINYLAEEQSDADETKDAVEEAGGDGLLLPGDVTEQGMCEGLVEKTVERFGGIDVLVSNAAYQRRKDSLDELSDEELEHTFDTNIFAYMRLARAALRPPSLHFIRRSLLPKWPEMFYPAACQGVAGFYCLFFHVIGRTSCVS